MNRLKVWVFAFLVAAVLAFTLRSHAARLRAQAVAGLDARLAAAAAQVAASSRSLAREASAAAALAARDARLGEALAAKEAAPARKLPRRRPAPSPASPDDEATEAALREAARAALSAAERAFGFELPTGSVVTAGNREWLSRKGDPSPAEGETMAALRGAIAGKATRGHLRLNGAVYYGVAAPVADGSGLVVLVPVDAAWVQGVAKAAGADVTLVAPEVKLATSAAATDAQAVQAARPAEGAAAAVGALGKVPVRIGRFALPPLPSLFGEVPAARVRAVPLEGLEGGLALVSLPTAAALAPVIGFEWLSLFGIAGVLLAGLVVGLLVRAAPAAAALPDALVKAAARIEKGDFAARAPELPGKLGTVAAALNRAAELAGPAAAAATAPAAAAAAPPADAAAPEAPFAPAAAAAPFAAAAPAPAAPAFDPLAAPAPSASPAPAPLAPALLQAAAQAAPAPAGIEVDEDVHWQQVFQDFLRTRATCGEATEGLTYEKFRLKLEGNKATLVAKYGCRTVKFQVYVKEGKAALKATPVK
jgi:hypothetical protein